MNSSTKILIILRHISECFGHESSIQGCHWNRRQMGSGVCDHHPNLGLRCLPFHHKESRSAQGHWRGIRFEGAPERKDLTGDNTLYVSRSKSVLRHVEVIGAGRGMYKGKANATSAIETWGVPPRMEHILVENSAYNGKNESAPVKGTQILKCKTCMHTTTSSTTTFT